jgi:hypothetical protein
MRSGVGLSLVAALSVSGFVSGAAAEMTVYYHVGGWDAFSGPGVDGKPVCGIGSTNSADASSFSLRFQIGGEVILFEAKKPGWSIPAGTAIPVVMQIGLDTPWSLQATGDGQTVRWELGRAAVQTFDVQFRRSSSMTLTFPSGNEPPWTIGLYGSTAISNAFGRCVTDFTRRSGGQPIAPLPTGPTQPFGEAPGQPASPAPTQPVAPK